MKVFRRFIYAIIISLTFTQSLTFTHQAAAFRISPGTPYQDPASYFYAGILTQLGYASLNPDHPKIVSRSPSYSTGAFMLGLLVGRQWMEYLATELTFECLIGYAGRNYGLWRSSLIRTDLNFYTLGLGLDAIPMLPLSDYLSLLFVLGTGYKKAYITEKRAPILDSMGWKIIPRIGVGVALGGANTRVTLKLLTELNNLFRNDNQSVFMPSFLFGINISLSFK